MTTTVLHTLYTDVAGYQLSAAGKARIGREDDSALTYGECTPEAVERILAVTGAAPGEVFYDLGSGTGKMVVYAAFLAPFKKVVGIELLPELHEAAVEVGKRYDTEIKRQFTDERRNTELDFRLDDIFDADLSEADVIVNHCCTCFDDGLMQRCLNSLKRCKTGARIVTITRTLADSCFEPIATSMCQMGWGCATIHAYRKR